MPDSQLRARSIITPSYWLPRALISLLPSNSVNVTLAMILHCLLPANLGEMLQFLRIWRLSHSHRVFTLSLPTNLGGV